MTSDIARDDPLTGVVLGDRYRLGPRIGRGGMASVFRAVDESLGRAVAVKVFAADSDGIDDPARRQSETALLASVEHRALVRLYDAATDAPTGRRFLVMELVDGTDLGRVLRAGPLRRSEAASLALDLGEALHVIHERGIVHRDLKPANVLLESSRMPGRTWNAKLADFGVARLVDQARLTDTGLIIGTPAYLSPEQVSGTTPGSASDVYALGLVLLEALTGRRAFPGPVAESAGARLVRDPEVPAAVGPEWSGLIRAMTARDPAARPSAIEVAATAAAFADPAGDARATAPTLVLPSTGAGSPPDAPHLVEPATAATEAPTLVLAAGAGGAAGAGAGTGAGAASPRAGSDVDDARAAPGRPPVRRRVVAGALLAALLTAVIATAATISTTTADRNDRVPVPAPSSPTSTPEPAAPAQTAPPAEETTEPSDDDAPGNSGEHRNDDKDDQGGKGNSGEGGD